jgi:hypothetical protein
MMKFVTLALAVALLVAAPAFAAETLVASKPAAAAAAANPAKADKKAKTEEKLICTREPQTDSFMTKRVCRTQEQIEAERRNAEVLENDRQLLGGRPDFPPGR